MERRGANTWLVAVLAIAVGFLAAWLIFGNKDTENSSATVSATSATTNTDTTATATDSSTTATAPSTTSTTTTGTATTPENPQATVPACIDLWNNPNNRGNQTYLVNVMSRQPVRVHVGVTSDVPPRCLVTIVANNGDAYVFPEGGGSTYPYAQAPGTTDSSKLPSAQKTQNALEQRDGTLAAR